MAPPQQCLTAGDARAKAAPQQCEDFSTILGQQPEAMPAPVAAALKTLNVPSIDPAKLRTTPADSRAVAKLLQWVEHSAIACQQRRDACAAAAVQRWAQFAALLCRRRTAAAVDAACTPPLSTRQAPTCCDTHQIDSPQCISLVEHYRPATTLLDLSAAPCPMSFSCLCSVQHLASNKFAAFVGQELTVAQFCCYTGHMEARRQMSP